MAVTARPTGTPESPRRGPRRPTQKRGAATQEEVILGAARIFSTVGYAAASLSMISADSGVSQGSLYFHFRSKEDIARAVISEQHHRSFALVAREIEANGDPVAQLITVSRLLVDQLVDDVVVRAGFRLGMDESALEDVAADFYGQWAEGTALMLQRAVDMGRVQTELPVADLARLLVGFFTGTQAMSRATNSHGDLAVRVAEMWHLIVRGIVPMEQQSDVLQIVEREFRSAKSTCADEVSEPHEVPPLPACD